MRGPAAALLAELLLVSEGNRLRRVDLASLAQPPPRQDVLIENAAQDAARGRDVNGMICALPDRSGRFVAGEDTGQPEQPAGWGLFEADGRQIGKLVAPSAAAKPDPYGCAFDAAGRLFTTEIGDPGFGSGNGRLIQWFPPFDAAEPASCTLAADIGTATGIAIDGAGRVYVASSSGLRIERYLPPFPSGPAAADGCPAEGAAAKREIFVWARPLAGLLTYSGLAFAPGGNLYAASVATGRIGEFAPDGRLLRLVLDPGRWLPPYPTGTPQGLAVDAAGSLYFADLDLSYEGWTPRPGPDGKVWRIRFEDGAALAPELVLRGLAFPDGVALAPGALAK
jgi:sugar lactone lactonase YvrE